MINQMSQNENTQNQFSIAIRQLQLGKLLRKSNIVKSCGISAYEVFQDVICKGWFLPPNTYGCGSFVVN